MHDPVQGTRKAKLLRSLFLVPLLIWIAVPAYAQFGSSVVVSSNSFATATLQPPTGLLGSGSCDGNSPKVTVTWSSTSSTFAGGYDVYQGTTNGGPYSKIAHATGLTTASYTDQGLVTGTTYFYVIQSTAASWTSVDSSQVQAATPASCP